MSKQFNNNDIEHVNLIYAYSNEKPKKITLIVMVVLIAIIMMFLIWASLSEIDELARGEGKVIPTSKVQKVQSLDGGILSDILVKEGEVINKEDALLKIDTTRFQASLEENLQMFLSLLAIRQRLKAEIEFDLNKEVEKLEFPKEVLENKSRYDVVEQQFYETRIHELKSSFNVLYNQLEQKKQEYLEIKQTIKNFKIKLDFIEEQRKTIKRLVKAKIKSRFDLLNIEKEYNQTQGDLEGAKLSLKKSTMSIHEYENRLIQEKDTFRMEAASELNKITSEINKLEAKLVSDEDKIDKTILRSPVKGIVKQIYQNSIGSVIQSGMDLVEIVPLSNNLLVEAKISPKDIAFINPNHKAIVKLTAYDFSIYGGLEGKIEEISADSILDKDSKDSKSYYRVVIRTKKNYLERYGEKLPVIPGMVANVDIITGKKSILDFLLKPILKVKQNAFHER